MNTKPFTLEINPLEQAALENALSRHIDYCKGCLETPGNEEQKLFIKTELRLCRALLARLPK